MAFQNERATILIDGRVQAAIVLIASRLVRQIATSVRPGDIVQSGQRLGMIRFGSQVDLVLPARPDLQLRVQPGDRVRAAETIIAVVGASACVRGEAHPAASSATT